LAILGDLGRGCAKEEVTRAVGNGVKVIGGASGYKLPQLVFVEPVHLDAPVVQHLDAPVFTKAAPLLRPGEGNNK